MKARLIFATVLLMLVAIFAIQNATIVEIRLLFWQVAIPRAVLIFLMLGIGIVIGWFMRAMFRIVRDGSQGKRT